MPFLDKLAIATLAAGTAGFVYLEDLTGTGLGIKTKSVDAVPVNYSRYLKLGDGSLSGRGWKQAEWHLNGIRHAHWNALKAYATSQSTQVYIRTYSEDGKTFANYLALMHWPENAPNRDHDVHVVLDFNIRFTQLILQP
jgi:hypothetical protein